MKISGTVTDFSTVEIGDTVRVTLRLDTGDVVEQSLTMEGWEMVKPHLGIGMVFMVEAEGPPELAWGRLPRIPG